MVSARLHWLFAAWRVSGRENADIDCAVSSVGTSCCQTCLEKCDSMEVDALTSKRERLQDLWHLNRRMDDVALALENSAQVLTICAETQASLN